MATPKRQKTLKDMGFSTQMSKNQSEETHDNFTEPGEPKSGPDEEEREREDTGETPSLQGDPDDLNKKENNGPRQPLLGQFPLKQSGSQKRSFTPTYYRKYPFIEYSVQRDAVFCYACRTFPPVSGHAGVEDIFRSTGFSNWKKIDERLKKHSDSKSHKDAMTSWRLWQKSQEGKGIDVLTANQHKSQIENNRKAVGTLARIALFCAQQAIALRGHRESDDDPSANHGNFLELLRLLKTESTEVQESMDKLPKNATYTSKDSQNELLSSAYSVLKRDLIDEIKESAMYSIIADEARDISKTEQMSISVRYVQGCFIKERFLVFIDVHDLCAKALANALSDALRSNGLDLKQCIAQCYDGASVMSGHLTGVQAQFQTITGSPCPYVHCHAHRLNLVLVDTCKSVTHAAQMIGLFEAVYRFVSSSTRRHDLFIREQKDSKVKVMELQMQSDTRWACKYKAINIFVHRYPEICSFFTKMSQSDNTCEAAEARGLLSQLKDFKAVFMLHILFDLLGKAHSLACIMQGKSVNFGDVDKLAKATTASIRQMRSQESFDDILAKAKAVAEKAGIASTSDAGDETSRRHRYTSQRLDGYFVTESLPRVNENETGYLTYRRSMYEMIDRMSNEMDRRFVSNPDITKACLASDPESGSFLDIHTMKSSLESFPNANIDVPGLENQTAVAKQMFLKEKPPTTEEVLKELFQMKKAFPDLYTYFQLVCTIPVSSATAERSFSTMKRVKTHLRATMGQERLSSLSALAIERESTQKLLADVTTVVDHFAKGKRRLCLK